MQLKHLLLVMRQMGLRYTLFRLKYEFQRRTGLLRKTFPQNPPKRVFINLETWRKTAPAFFWNNRQDVPVTRPFSVDEEGMQHMLNGEIRFFQDAWFPVWNDNNRMTNEMVDVPAPSHHPHSSPRGGTFASLGSYDQKKRMAKPAQSPPSRGVGGVTAEPTAVDWTTHPITGYRWPADIHWSEVSDFSPESGDIKFVWEKSRFTFLCDVMRYDLQTGSDHSEFVFQTIASWLRQNPVNTGPNYKCSQEISLRLMHWIQALYFYRDSPQLTPALFEEIQHALYWQIRHVYDHIDFARIAVRNNHALTETLLLFTAGLLFPFFPEAEQWKRDGLRWFEAEVEYQVYPDGSYLQFSVNYHRVVIQLFNWAFSLAAAHHIDFKDFVYQKAYLSLQFLYRFQDLKTGQLPNYGSNDGALFFPLSGSTFRDYRPALDTLHRLLTRAPLYAQEGAWEEEAEWFNTETFGQTRFPALQEQTGGIRFDAGGYYGWREKDSLTFIRCGNHKNRPLQADNLHLDLWQDGCNVLSDTGSYLYNTDPALVRYFMGTAGHNTVMLGDYDQMEKGSRFMWFYWTQALEVAIQETEMSWIFTGRIKAFRQLGTKIEHERRVEKRKNEAVWVVTDRIFGAPGHIPMVQRWRSLFPDKLIFEVSQNAVRQDRTAWWSDHYGSKIPCTEILFSSAGREITTTIRIR